MLYPHRSTAIPPPIAYCSINPIFTISFKTLSVFFTTHDLIGTHILKSGGAQMVKQQQKNNRKKRSSKDFTANSAKARKIDAEVI